MGLREPKTVSEGHGAHRLAQPLQRVGWRRTSSRRRLRRTGIRGRRGLARSARGLARFCRGRRGNGRGRGAGHRLCRRSRLRSRCSRCVERDRRSELVHRRRRRCLRRMQWTDIRRLRAFLERLLNDDVGRTKLRGKSAARLVDIDECDAGRHGKVDDRTYDCPQILQ